MKKLRVLLGGLALGMGAVGFFLLGLLLIWNTYEGMKELLPEPARLTSPLLARAKVEPKARIREGTFKIYQPSGEFKRMVESSAIAPLAGYELSGRLMSINYWLYDNGVFYTSHETMWVPWYSNHAIKRIEYRDGGLVAYPRLSYLFISFGVIFPVVMFGAGVALSTLALRKIFRAVGLHQS